MSHTNQTPNYHLPQFIGTDKPAWLVDVNQAMADIDTQMKANETASATAEADAQSALSGVTALNSQVGGIQTSVTALETQAPLDEAQIETNRQNIATNAQNIVGIDNRLGHEDISAIGDDITDAIVNEDAKVGDLADLDTTDKTSIVNAINEAVAGGGSDASTVRYNNGWIEYTPDGGTTWVQLINTDTPEQLLPVMSSNTSAVGVVTVNNVATQESDAYKAIDGTDPASYVDLGGQNSSITFTFANLTYVKNLKCKYISRDNNSTGGQFAMEYTADGVTWISLTSVTVTNHVDKLEYTANVNQNIIGLRARKINQAGAIHISEIEAWN